MATRRPLVEGLKTDSGVDRAVEEEFVYNGGPSTTRGGAPRPSAEGRAGKGQAAGAVGRVPLTIRFRADYAALLKRASLERQLNGASPSSLQDIVEEAVLPWLRSNGYLS
jgi:hypothetical protein